MNTTDIYTKMYLNSLMNGNIDFAKKLRLDNSPKTIHSFIRLSKSGNTKMDIRNLNTIANKSIWLSSAKYMDDPFECKGLYVDYNKLSKLTSNKIAKTVKDLEHQFNSSLLFSCFVEGCSKKISMWAQYSNNFQGCCIEYEVVDPDILFPVYYGIDRFDITNAFVHLYNSNKSIEEKISSFTLVVQKYLYKNKSWEYQNEYRLIYPKLVSGIAGANVKLDEVGLRIKRIIVGINCNSRNKATIKKICSEIGCEYCQSKISDTKFEIEF